MAVSVRQRLYLKKLDNRAKKILSNMGFEPKKTSRMKRKGVTAARLKRYDRAWRKWFEDYQKAIKK